MLAGKTGYLRVESTAQTAFSSTYDKQMHLVVSGSRHQLWRICATRYGSGNICQNLTHPLGIGARSFGRILRTPKLRRGDHLHRLGDLLRRLDGGDPVSQILK